jgi:hypothetical protein
LTSLGSLIKDRPQHGYTLYLQPIASLLLGPWLGCFNPRPHQELEQHACRQVAAEQARNHLG